MLRRPAFDTGQFEIVKNEHLATLRAGLSSAQERCFNALRRALYPWPTNSIHYLPTIEERIERLTAVSLEEVRELHERFFGGDQMEISIVGDFEPGETLNVIAEQLSPWKSRAGYKWIAMPHRPIDSRPHNIYTPGQPMAVVALGTDLEMRDDHPDYPALRFASYILGESFTSRRYRRLRFDENLSYHVGGVLRADEQDERTSFFAYAFCAPSNADKALTALREEIHRWAAAGITPEELAEGKRSYALEFRQRLSDDAFLADQLATALEVNRKFAFQAEFLKKIEALTVRDVAGALKKHLAGAPLVEIKAGDIESGG